MFCRFCHLYLKNTTTDEKAEERVYALSPFKIDFFSVYVKIELLLTSNYFYMPKIAVIKTGGKQYIVKAKDKLKIEKLSAKQDAKVNFEVLMTSNEDGTGLKLGKPILKDSSVEAKILNQGRAKKVRVVHYKNKTRYHKVYGHRQPYTQVEITKIN